MSQRSQRGITRAHSKLEYCAFPPEIVRRRACARAPRYNRRWLGAGRRSWRVAPKACAEGKRHVVSALLFHSA